MTPWSQRLRRWEGHLWTIAASQLSRVESPPSQPWSTHVEDRGGLVRLSGAWRDEGGDTALVVLHGLGGSINRPYCHRAAQAAAARGWSCLRLALRGADRRGEDFYHAGLTADLEAALASTELRGMRRLFCLGYSLGGHIVLRWALRPTDERVRAVSAICPPLDLAKGSEHLDRHRIYRRHILAGLRAMYREVAARGPVPTPVRELAEVDSMRVWDSLTVVPRYGFESVDDYYRSQSVGPELSRLQVDSLVVPARFDPLIPAEVSARWLSGDLPRVQTWWLERGGHVGYPPNLRRSPSGPSGVEAQALEWMDQFGGREPSRDSTFSRNSRIISS